jgi:hypothetical protein
MEEQDPKLGDAGNIKSEPKGLLYHYTDQKGLLGIIESKCIWATHVRYLNDESEFIAAWEKSWNTLQEKIRQIELPGKEPEFRQSLERVFRNSRQRIGANDYQKGAYYVFCLTDDSASNSHKFGFDGDRLSQWRGYSRGGYGFSLGFDAEALSDSFTASGGMLPLFNRCEYREQEQNTQIDRLVSKHLDKFLSAWDSYFSSRNAQNSDAETRKQGVVKLWQLQIEMYLDFIEFGMFMKHRGFREEDEWRACFIAEDQTLCSFRESIFGLTPYLTVGFDLGKAPWPLKRIVVGPGPHKDETVNGVKLLLESNGIKVRIEDSKDGVEVVPSQIPYRNW